MVTAKCPECQQFIELEIIPEIGQNLMCTNCKYILEVIWVIPIFLDYKDNEILPPGSKNELIK